jgi:hypothetical protein
LKDALVAMDRTMSNIKEFAAWHAKYSFIPPGNSRNGCSKVPARGSTRGSSCKLSPWASTHVCAHAHQ